MSRREITAQSRVQQTQYQLPPAADRMPHCTSPARPGLARRQAGASTSSQLQSTQLQPPSGRSQAGQGRALYTRAASRQYRSAAVTAFSACSSAPAASPGGQCSSWYW